MEQLVEIAQVILIMVRSILRIPHNHLVVQIQWKGAEVSLLHLPLKDLKLVFGSAIEKVTGDDENTISSTADLSQKSSVKVITLDLDHSSTSVIELKEEHIIIIHLLLLLEQPMKISEPLDPHIQQQRIMVR